MNESAVKRKTTFKLVDLGIVDDEYVDIITIFDHEYNGSILKLRIDPEVSFIDGSPHPMEARHKYINDKISHYGLVPEDRI